MSIATRTRKRRRLENGQWEDAVDTDMDHGEEVEQGKESELDLARKQQHESNDQDEDEEFAEKCEELERSMLEMVTSWTPKQREKFLSRLPYDKLKDVERAIQPFTRKNPFDTLPSDVLLYIFSFMGVHTLLQMRLVCKFVKASVDQNLVWKRKYEEQGFPAMSRAEELAVTDWMQHFRDSYVFYQKVDHTWRQGRPSFQRIQTNSNGVYCIQYDDDKIVSGSRDHKVRIWNMKTHALELVMSGHTGSVLCLQYDQNKVITGSSDTRIIMWDIHTGEAMTILPAHDSSVLHLGFDEEILVSCSKDNKVKVWEFTGPWSVKLKMTLTAHEAPVNVVQFDKRYIISASGDKTIKVFARDTGTLLHTLKGHTRGIACLHFYKHYIVSGSSDRKIKVWDVNKFKLIRTLEGHSDLVRCIRMDDRFVVSGSYDRTIKIWDLETGYNVQTLAGTHTHRVFKVHFDRCRIVSSSYDDTIVVWDFVNPAEEPQEDEGV